MSNANANTPAWAKNMSFITDPKGEPHTVSGKTLVFLPISAMTLLKLKGLVEPVSKCLSVLFEDKNRDAGVVQRSDSEGFSEVISEGVSESVLRMRSEQKSKAVEDLMKALSDDSNLDALGEVILDSLRKHDWGGHRPPAMEFMKYLGLPDLVQMLIGVAKANKGVFGPLESKMSGLGKKAEEILDARLAEGGLTEELKLTDNGSNVPKGTTTRVGNT